MTEFEQEIIERLDAVEVNSNVCGTASVFLEASIRARYSYNFFWQGRPIIQYPQDMMAMQELIWSIKPDLIIETGIAHGGSLIFSASMLALLEYCDAVEQGCPLDPTRPERQVIGLDIDIRAHNRAAIEAHPMANRIQMIQGSSVDPAIVEQVRIPGTYMVRPAMQEENCCLVEGNVAAIYPASLRGIISEADPRALMEFAYLAVLNQYISLSLRWLLSPSGSRRGGRAFHAITVIFTLSNSWCGTRLMPDQGGLIGRVRGS